MGRTSTELHEALERVHDRESFLDFVDELLPDREAAVAAEEENPTPFLGAVPDKGGWYNFTIESYLEACLRWAESGREGTPHRLPEAPSWKAFADFLYCGKI